MNHPGQFEQAITELESIVAQLEKGELDIENALNQFEKGVSLARVCQETLRKAEQTIELLSLNPTQTNDAHTD